MKNGQSVKQVVEQTVRHYINMAEKQHGRTFEMPTIEYFHKGRKAGHAKSWLWTVGFNTGLLEDNLQRYMVRTIPHEVAHLVVYAVHGQLFKNGKRDSHGEKFKAQMDAFGCENTRCHTMDTSKVSQKKRKTTKHPVKCTCCDWSGEIGTIRKNKMLRGTLYTHRGGKSHRIELV